MSSAPPLQCAEPEPLTPEVLATLRARPAGPSVSIYLPTHRAAPPDDLARILLRGLLTSATKALSQRGPDVDVERLLGPLATLPAQPWLIAPAHDGLAAFATDGMFRVVAVDGPIEPRAIVARRFHLLPLVRLLSAIETMLLIAMTERIVRCYVARVSTLSEVRLSPFLLPRDGRTGPAVVRREEIVVLEPTQPHRVLHGRGAFGGRTHGGFGARTDASDTDTFHFLHATAQMLEHAPERDPSWPVIVVALPQLAAEFAAAAPWTQGGTVQIHRDPQRLTDPDLTTLVDEALQSTRQHRRRQLLAAFHEARSHDRGSGDLADIARAAVSGQVDTLLVETGRREAGCIDDSTGVLTPAQAFGGRSDDRACGDDLYEDLAAIVTDRAGRVVCLDRLEMPTESGVAALYRFATG